MVVLATFQPVCLMRILGCEVPSETAVVSGKIIAVLWMLRLMVYDFDGGYNTNQNTGRHSV